MKYEVVTGASLASITRYVNDMLKIGWKLQGGICCYSHDFYQAMYRDN